MTWSDKLLSRVGVSEDIGIVVLSRRLLVFSGTSPNQVNEVSLGYVAPPPAPPPAALPPHVRDGLMTKRHFDPAPHIASCFRRNEIIDFEAAESAIQQALHSVGPRRRRFVKPRVVVADASRESMTRKRALLDATERAGARKIYLTSMAMCCALGAGLSILDDEVHAVLLVEHDWSVFSVMTYADEIASRFIPVGTDDIPDPRYGSDWRDLLGYEISSALDELRPPQTEKLQRSGIHCCGQAATDPWAETAQNLTGFTAHPTHPDEHPAVEGLRHYLNHLDEWKPA
ncbi:MAG: rod shape-determining protein [Planctomycetota bacterium]